MSKVVHLKQAKRAQEIILSDPTNHITIPDMARELGTNEHSLKVAFKELFGCGLYEYRKKVKLEKAKSLIENSSMNLKEISEVVGYERHTSFLTAFKKHFGYTPGILVTEKEEREKDEFLELHKTASK